MKTGNKEKIILTINGTGNRANVDLPQNGTQLQFGATYESGQNGVIYTKLTPEDYPGDEYFNRFTQIGGTGAGGFTVKGITKNNLQFALTNNSGQVTGNSTGKVVAKG